MGNLHLVHTFLDLRPEKRIIIPFMNVPGAVVTDVNPDTRTSRSDGFSVSKYRKLCCE
jgi:hypothetical protein